jgi:hypothetical protein
VTGAGARRQQLGVRIRHTVQVDSVTRQRRRLRGVYTQYLGRLRKSLQDMRGHECACGFFKAPSVLTGWAICLGELFASRIAKPCGVRPLWVGHAGSM